MAKPEDYFLTVYPESEWGEEDGSVLWWCFPISEPPYVGTPNDLGGSYAYEIADGVTITIKDVGGWPGYHTHWTRIPMPTPPVEWKAKD